MSGNSPKKTRPKEGNFKNNPDTINNNASPKRRRQGSATERPVLGPTTNRITPAQSYDDDMADMDPPYSPLRPDNENEPQHTQSHERKNGIEKIRGALETAKEWMTYDLKHNLTIAKELSGDPALADTLHIVSNYCINMLGERPPTDQNAELIKFYTQIIYNSSEQNLYLARENAELKGEIESNRAPKPNNQPRPPEEGLSESQHAPNPNAFTRSDRPTPIKPTTRQPSQSPPKQKFAKAESKIPTQRYHESRLIINFQPRIEKEMLPSAGEAVHLVNALLQRNTHDDPTPTHYSIQGMIMSHNANPILVTGDGCVAEDLRPWYDEICQIFTDHAPADTEIEMDHTATAIPDYQHFQVKLGQVPRYSWHGEEITTQELREHIQTACGGRTTLEYAADPRYLIRSDDESNLASVVVPLKSAEQATALLRMRSIFIAGERCYTSRFDERPRPTFCTSCSSLSHRERSKQCDGERCAFCTDKEHTTAEHPMDWAELCINCGGTHASRSLDCPIRKQRASGTNASQSTDGGANIKTKAAKKRRPKTQPADKEGFSEVGTGTRDREMMDTNRRYAQSQGLGAPFSTEPAGHWQARRPSGPEPRTRPSIPAQTEMATAASNGSGSRMDEDNDNTTPTFPQYA